MGTASAALIDYNHLHIILVSILGLSGLFFILWAGSQIKKKRLMKCCLGSSLGIILISFALILLLILSNLYTYHRLTYERPLAEIHLQELDAQHFLVSIDQADNKQRQIFELKGDEWQIDARILKWKYPVIWLGLDSHYQLERISGRYSDIESEINKDRTVFALSEHSKNDIWPMIRQYQKYLPLIDAFYGSASYLPMSDQAEYELVLTQTGLIARPLNDQAKKSIGTWN